jgi:hypothetical protein
MNESIIRNLIKDLHINEFEAVDENKEYYSYKKNEMSAFSGFHFR